MAHGGYHLPIWEDKFKGGLPMATMPQAWENIQNIWGSNGNKKVPVIERSNEVLPGELAQAQAIAEAKAIAKARADAEIRAQVEEHDRGYYTQNTGPYTMNEGPPVTVKTSPLGIPGYGQEGQSPNVTVDSWFGEQGWWPF